LEREKGAALDLLTFRPIRKLESQQLRPVRENGEIHTIAVAGPMFRKPVRDRVGDTVNRNGVAYADIIPMN
jgi:diphthamide synthase (EF-2-diphthine--ammonia ligase)